MDQSSEGVEGEGDPASAAQHAHRKAKGPDETTPVDPMALLRSLVHQSQAGWRFPLQLKAPQRLGKAIERAIERAIGVMLALACTFLPPSPAPTSHYNRLVVAQAQHALCIICD